MSIISRIRMLFAKAEENNEEKAVETVMISKKHAFFLKELVKSLQGSDKLFGVNVSEILEDLEEGKIL